MRTGRPIVVLAPQRGDHTPNHIKWLAEGWAAALSDAPTDLLTEASGAAPLLFLVAPGFRQTYPDLVNAPYTRDGVVDFAELPLAATTDVGAPLHAELPSRASWYQRHTLLRRQRWAEWHAGVRLATQMQARHCLILNLDLYQTAWILGSAFPCPVAGIYHNLMFYYPRLLGSRLTAQEQVRARVQKWIVRRILAQPNLGAIFCFDPLAAQALATMMPMTPKAQVLPLPMAAITGSASVDEVAALRARYGVEPGRRIFLLMGGIRRQRGFYTLMEALHQLPKGLAAQVCLLVVGRQAEPSSMQPLLEQAHEQTAAQVISRDEFIAAGEIATHHALTDIVLATHTRHIGISESIAHAAAAPRPVLASEFGLLGALVRRHQLGVTVDCRSPRAIAAGIAVCVSSPLDRLFDVEQARCFARNNSAQRCVQTLIDYLAAI